MIKADDVVLHKPSGETWVVCGVDRAASELIPCGYPFPTIAKLADCELVSPSKTTKQPRSSRIAYWNMDLAGLLKSRIDTMRADRVVGPYNKDRRLSHD